jgi:hypothetical protein
MIFGFIDPYEIFVTSGLITDWPLYASVFAAFTPDVKAAAFVSPLQTTAQTVAGYLPSLLSPLFVFFFPSSDHSQK